MTSSSPGPAAAWTAPSGRRPRHTSPVKATFWLPHITKGDTATHASRGHVFKGATTASGPHPGRLGEQLPLSPPVTGCGCPRAGKVGPRGPCVRTEPPSLRHAGGPSCQNGVRVSDNFFWHEVVATRVFLSTGSAGQNPWGLFIPNHVASDLSTRPACARNTASVQRGSGRSHTGAGGSRTPGCAPGLREPLPAPALWLRAAERGREQASGQPSPAGRSLERGN